MKYFYCPFVVNYMWSSPTKYIFCHYEQSIKWSDFLTDNICRNVLFLLMYSSMPNSGFQLHSNETWNFKN